MNETDQMAGCGVATFFMVASVALIVFICRGCAPADLLTYKVEQLEHRVDRLERK